ncbi:PREDICTED: ELKS/Rab6-interacting/CAST family member 1-like isoform X2 [Priapulus caudatus]|uniref:ELKS/Rab6-interacting/CAST family member 1-like isoform X2 n=1 Tax=Priapulus caudatus TaxID=37621 RepID=A0ABM1E5T5_PRICU|nr:PREDICTED: ELKS/Rab6-interacting/CAST family member 1-like isoform X2 [Priapulus caudatus]
MDSYGNKSLPEKESVSTLAENDSDEEIVIPIAPHVSQGSFNLLKLVREQIKNEEKIEMRSCEDVLRNKARLLEQLEEEEHQAKQSLSLDNIPAATARSSQLFNVGRSADRVLAAPSVHGQMSRASKTRLRGTPDLYSSGFEDDSSDPGGLLPRKSNSLEVVPGQTTAEMESLLKNLHVHHATVNTPGGESTARTSPPLNRDDEVAQLKESLQNMVSVLSDSERRLAEEQNIKEKVMAEVKRLSQQNAMLREQARASSGSDSGAPAFNSKPTQVLGMEARLTRAVQELEQERSQTAEVITELETKYAHQLSKLQVAEKDALRRLIRETERNKAQEDCIAALRDHIHKMLADVATTTTTDRRQRQRWIDTVRPGTKGSQEIQQILRAVQQEEGVHPSQPEEVVRCLWYRRKEVAAQLSLLQHYLAEIGLNTSKLPDELKRLLSEKMDMEQQIKNQAWEIHNRIRDRQVMENTLKERLASLTSKKNKLEAHVKTVAGQAAQLDAENKALKLNATSASSKADGGASSLRAEIETMQERLLVEVCKRQQLEAELQLITNKPQDNNLSHIANCTGTVDDAGTAKRLLHEREVELKSLQDVVRRQKLDIESLNTQLSSAQLQKSPLGGSREPNEADALVKLNNTSKDVQLLRDANITLERRFTAEYDTFQKEKTESGS